jgi:hypothetical protein
MNTTLFEKYKVVQLANPKTTNGGFTTDYVSLKNVNKAYIVAEMTQAVGHATALAPYQSTDVAATGAKVFTNVLTIMANEDTATSDTLVRKTDAVNYTVTNDIKNKQVIFEIDPSNLDTANDFDCIALVVADSSQATNFASVTAFLDMKYREDVPPAAITD